MKEGSKKVTAKKDFYQLVFDALKVNTNLIKISKDLNISKQKLNYYIRGLVNSKHLIKKGNGWYEINKFSKKTTQYGKNLKKDMIRGHAYVWKIKLQKEIKDWDKRIEILKKNKINFNLVGAMKTTPRIKVYGRKVWLCNKHLRVFEKKDKSYYGDNSIEAKSKAFNEILIIIKAIENKLQINLRPYLIKVVKEHYALIKNDLAKHCNKNGEIIRVSDEDGEWLLVDDSLEKGGELENVGKKSLGTNIELQTWYNDHKKHNFKVTPSFVLEGMKNNSLQINQVTQNQQMFNKNFESHVSSIKTLGNSANANAKSTELLASTILKMKDSFEVEIKSLKEEINSNKKKENIMVRWFRGWRK